jgi:hypothetical protein
MKRPDALLCLLLCLASARAEDGVALRYRADIDFAPGPAFARLPLPASTYARSRQADLGDLRILDARGQRVPFARLAPRPAAAESLESRQAARLYPLPAAPAGDGTWRMPLEVRIDGERVTLRRLAPERAAPGVSAGWLFDLGEAPREGAAPHALRLAWHGRDEFNAGYRLETSPDLRAWHAAGAGQILALTGAEGSLSQPLVALPANAHRFARLFWNDPAEAPKLSGADSLRRHVPATRDDDLAPLELPGSPTAPAFVGKSEPGNADAAQALYFDLGGDLPVTRLELRLDAETRIVPARIEARATQDTAWRPVTSTVFYRLRRGTESLQSPPVDVATQARWLRLLVDPRAAPLDAARARLVVQARLPSLVFAAQGTAPYSLYIGADKAADGALPLATLVPDLERERPRFGTARLGAWRENPQAARQADAEARATTQRRLLLWSVLVIGVAALGYMVWRQARAGQRAT